MLNKNIFYYNNKKNYYSCKQIKVPNNYWLVERKLIKLILKQFLSFIFYLQGLQLRIHF